MIKKTLIFIMLFSILASCGLPRPGPNAREILASAQVLNAEVLAVPVNADVARFAGPEDLSARTGFPNSFLARDRIDAELIYSGDLLNVTIWENIDDGLFGAIEGPSVLTEVPVDDQGAVFIPYAGRVQAAGRTIEQLRLDLVEEISAQTVDPQIMVARIPGNGATVTVLGSIAAQGVYPIDRSARTLRAMLAKAGGFTDESELTEVLVQRGHVSGSIWLDDLLAQPQFDIALMPGDQITVRQDRRAFTAIGAVSGQSLVEFPKPTINLIEALGLVGGLDPRSGYPDSVFILRAETPTRLQQLGGAAYSGQRQAIYAFDLTEPSGLFFGEQFNIRDGDILYAAEAPYTQFQKALSAITGVASPVSGLNDTFSN